MGAPGIGVGTGPMKAWEMLGVVAVSLALVAIVTAGIMWAIHLTIPSCEHRRVNCTRIADGAVFNGESGYASNKYGSAYLVWDRNGLSRWIDSRNSDAFSCEVQK